LDLNELERIRKLETLSFCASLDVEDIRFLDLDDGNIDQDQLDLEVKKLIRELKPDIVLTHPKNDGHPDHALISKVIHRNKDNFEIRYREEDNNLYKDDVNWKIDMLHKYFKSQVPVLLMDAVIDNMGKEDSYI
tara:strand:- start:2880 stop:3281 length:402 start_codon:yes stop_codon:yes gene_type:complete